MSQLDTALLTLEQAKTTWCPEARSLGSQVVAVNRLDGDAFDNSMCIGDRCAFWRWHDRDERWQKPLAQVKAHAVPADGLNTGGWTPRPDDGRDWLLDEDKGEWYVPAPSLPPRGYCGKAGHPLQAALIEAQMELIHYQLYDARRA